MKDQLYRKLENLNKESDQIFDDVNDLSEEDLHNSSYGWNVIQVLSHLNVAESGSILYMKKKMQAGNEMPDFSFMNKMKLQLTKGLLQSSLKWKAPGVVANPNGEYSLKELKEKWDKTRLKTKEYIDEYPDELLQKAVYKHPIAGRLDLAGAIDSFIYHQRHHIHQIRRIKKVIKG